MLFRSPFEGTFSAGLKGGEFLDAVRRFRASGAEALFARFVKNHNVVTPTLVAYRPQDPAAPDDPHSRYVALSQRKEWEKQVPRASAEQFAESKRTFSEFQEVVRLMHRAGVVLITGTDIAGNRVPGFTLHEELEALVQSGLTPAEALRAATLTPATVVNKGSEMGSVEIGKLADLVLLDANPLDDIRNTQRIAAVVLRGRVFNRRDLDGLLRQAEELASRN